MSYLCYNAEFLQAEKAVLSAFNRGYRHGDGLFETMRLQNGNILLASYHFERLFAGMSSLKFRQSFSETLLMEKILELARLNDCLGSARVRLSVNRGNGSLEEEPKAEYLIECSALDQKDFHWNETGLAIGLFEDAIKPCDAFANLKSANRLHYVMAEIHARENGLDDCLLLNTHGNIAESTIANLFLIRGDIIITPSLDQGCVAGVMRRYLIEKLQASSCKLQERPCSIKDLYEADEVFLTNAIRSIQWVKSFRNKTYRQEKTKDLFNRFIRDLQPVSLQNGD